MVVCDGCEPRRADTIRDANRRWGDEVEGPRVIAGVFVMDSKCISSTTMGHIDYVFWYNLGGPARRF